MLDTDTFIFMVRGLKLSSTHNEREKQRQRLAARIQQRARPCQANGDDVGLSAITVAQLESGARNSGDYASGIVAVRKVLTPFQMWDFDATEAAEHSGVVRHGLETGAPPLAPWIF